MISYEGKNGHDDGSPHAVPCPAARHGDDPPMLYVRHLSTDDAWLFHCWSSPPCEYGEIARMLGIRTDSTRVIRSVPVSGLVAAYDHADPDEQHRLVLQHRPDFPMSQELRGAREKQFRGSANSVHLMLWAPEQADRHDSTLLVVGSEDEAMSLMRAGVYRQGYVPVTWYRAVRRVEDDRQSVDRADWSRVRGRRVAFWTVGTREAQAEMLRAAAMATVAGAAHLLMVDAIDPGSGDAGDAISMTDPEAIMAALQRTRVLPGYHPDSVDDGMSDLGSLLAPGVETATDVSMAVRVLCGHGDEMVLVSGHEGSDPAVELYWRTGTGDLERRPDGLGVALWESRTRFLEEMRKAFDAGDLSIEDHRVCLAHANRMGSPAGLRAVADCLGTAYGILERLGAVPEGLSYVSIPRVDGAPGELTAQDIGQRPSRKERLPRTEADVWILRALDVTENVGDRVSTSALWEAARSVPVSGDDPDRVWGMSRRAFTTRAMQLHGLSRTRSVRIDGKVFSGWVGVRLLTDGAFKRQQSDEPDRSPNSVETG